MSGKNMGKNIRGNRFKSSGPKFGGYVRITGGEYKGRQIRTPGENTHPMGERERIALFNMISEYLPEAKVLDLYSGGGTLGIEAISRGAESVLAVDSARHAVLTATTNMVELGIFETKGHVSQEDTTKIVKSADEDYLGPFDIVFADPPYDDYREELLTNLPKLVKNGGILVLSHPGEAPEITDMELLKTRKYARAHISIYQR